jgi:glyoxylase-like metal-dependent hydrolase (beta-lactamase superfamily II)
MTVVPGIHLLGGLAPAAAYVVETSEGLVLIDAGLDQAATELKQQMASLRLDWRRIRAIFLTHVHGDHSGGAQHLRAVTGARVYAGQGDAAVLRAAGPRDAFYSTYGMPTNITPHPTTVDVELSDGQEIAVGDVRFRALSTPGHTPGSICYEMERAGRQVLFSGDVIISLLGNQQSGARRTGPLGTYAAKLAPRYRGDAADFLATLRRLRGLPAPDLVLPGHPRRDETPMSPSMSQERWDKLLDDGIQEMEQLQARYAADGANFLDGIPKQLLPDLYYLGDFHEVAVYGFFAASKFFMVNAPGGQGLKEFLMARLRQVGRKPVAPAAILLTSADPPETAGLSSLLAQDRSHVVASPAAWEELKKSCPADTRFLAAENLAKQHWFPVTPIVLAGRGRGPMAYALRWGGNMVLISGRIPIKVTTEAKQALLKDYEQGQLNVSDYRDSVRRLAQLKPDLWLPAFPSNGQNANLYDNDWEVTLFNNDTMFR